MVKISVSSKREIQVCDIPDHLMLITDSQDRESIEEHFGRPEWMDYGCYFVEVLDGDYGLVYGCESSVPYNDLWVDTLQLEYED
jgi:hypothetical protein